MLAATFITKINATLTGRMPRERRLAFRNMKDDQCHREAVEISITLHATTKDVGDCDHISSAHEEDNANNRKPLMKMLSNIRVLVRQGITDVVTDKEIILTSHRFFTFELKTILLMPHCWSRKTNKYAWQMQNEMLKVMGLEVLRDVAASLHSSPFYSIMTD